MSSDGGAFRQAHARKLLGKQRIAAERFSDAYSSRSQVTLVDMERTTIPASWRYLAYLGTRMRSIAFNRSGQNGLPPTVPGRRWQRLPLGPSGVGVVQLFARNVIVTQIGRPPFATHCERLPIRREYRFVDTPTLFWRDLT